MSEIVETLRTTDPLAFVFGGLLLFGLHVWLRRGHVPRKERKERARRRSHPDT